MTQNYNVSEDALWVMTFAEMAAGRDDRAVATSADVLLGLMLVSDPVFDSEVPCLGGVLLRAACASPDDLPTLLDLGWGELPDEPSFSGRLTPGVAELLDAASQIGHDLGVSFIGSEHLLLSLVAETFDDDVYAWLTAAQLTEAGVLRQWVALLLRHESGDVGLGPPPAASA